MKLKKVIIEYKGKTVEIQADQITEISQQHNKDISKEMDYKKINNALSLEFRHTVAERIKEIYQGENGRYFLNVFTYADRHKTLPVEFGVIDDLYPPNLAVLDWIMEYCDPKKDVILDYGCGIGTMVMYLSHLGFKTYGYDTWDQIDKSVAVKFLKKYGLKNRLVNVRTQPRNYTVIFHCGINIDREMMTPIITRKNVRIVMKDQKYPSGIGHSEFDGWYRSMDFKQVCAYPDLISVYEKRNR